MITAEVAGRGVARILIDTGSSVDIIYSDCLKRLNVGCEVHPTETDVIGFSGDVLRSVGEVTLPVSLGDRPVIATGSVKFLIMDVESPFNMILGRPSLNMFQVVVSTYHAKIKFPVNKLVGEVRGDIPGKSGMLQFRPHINQIDLRRPVPDEKSKYDVIAEMGYGFSRVEFFSACSLLPVILMEHHSTPTRGHFGFHKTLARIKSCFLWPNMLKFVKEFVKNCDTCSGVKPIARYRQDFFTHFQFQQRYGLMFQWILLKDFQNQKGY